MGNPEQPASDEQGWVSALLSADIKQQLAEFHEQYSRVSVAAGWPRPRKKDSLERVLRAGLEAESKRLAEAEAEQQGSAGKGAPGAE